MLATAALTALVNITMEKTKAAINTSMVKLISQS